MAKKKTAPKVRQTMEAREARLKEQLRKIEVRKQIDVLRKTLKG